MNMFSKLKRKTTPLILIRIYDLRVTGYMGVPSNPVLGPHCSCLLVRPVEPGGIRFLWQRNSTPLHESKQEDGLGGENFKRQKLV